MRVLPIAIGTLSAIAVQELGLTRHTSTNNNLNEVHESNPAKSDDIELGQLGEPIATPERLPASGLAQPPASNPLPGLKPLNLTSQQKVALSRPYPPLQPLKLDILPLNKVVSNTPKARSPQPVGLEKFITGQTASVKPATAAKPLTDVQGHWAQPFIEALVARNIVKGFSDGRFQPDKPISSAEFSIMARQALPQQLLTIADLQKFYPERLATRADAAAFIYQTMAQAGQVPAIAAKETLVASAAGKQNPTKVASPKLTEKSNTVAANPATARNIGIAPPTTLPVPSLPPQLTETPPEIETPQPTASPTPGREIGTQPLLSTPLPPNEPLPVTAPTLTATSPMPLSPSSNLRSELIGQNWETMAPSVKAVALVEPSQPPASNTATNLTQPINIAVVGEVNRPGSYTLVEAGETAGRVGGMPTVTQAIQQSGGITQLADLRRVEVHRRDRSGTQQIITINLWDLLQKGDLKQDLLLQQGDRVIIPTAKAISPAEATRLAAANFSPDVIKVNVVGEVMQPGIVAVSPNTPLNQALLSAGGFNNRTQKKAVQLIRLNSNGTVTQQSITVDLTAGIANQTNPAVRHNDIVIVGRSGSAKLAATSNNLLTPLGRLLPSLLL
jgi:protein involved in polysaccharide export with SLBB domain